MTRWPGCAPRASLWRRFVGARGGGNVGCLWPVALVLAIVMRSVWLGAFTLALILAFGLWGTGPVYEWKLRAVRNRVRARAQEATRS